MAVLSGLAMWLALWALVCLPCLIAAILTFDPPLRALPCLLRRQRGRWRERSLAHRAGLIRRSGFARIGSGRGQPAVRYQLVGPPIETLAADLRRLGRQRIGVATRSPVWYAAISRAYDDRLALACHELEICEHLGTLAGIDRDIERVRVEGMLHAAGLRLSSAHASRQGH